MAAGLAAAVEASAEAAIILFDIPPSKTKNDGLLTRLHV